VEGVDELEELAALLGGELLDLLEPPPEAGVPGLFGGRADELCAEDLIDGDAEDAGEVGEDAGRRVVGVHRAGWNRPRRVVDRRCPAGLDPHAASGLLGLGPAEFVAAGRRPSVAVVGGEFVVAYERNSATPGLAQDVVVARREGAGAWIAAPVASTARTERLDVEVHERDGRLWLDWMHAAGIFGCAEQSGTTWLPAFVAWSDPSWIGIEGTRKAIARQVPAD
jgi:hypothetical protein